MYLWNKIVSVVILLCQTNYFLFNKNVEIMPPTGSRLIELVS